MVLGFRIYKGELSVLNEKTLRSSRMQWQAQPCWYVMLIEPHPVGTAFTPKFGRKDTHSSKKSSGFPFKLRQRLVGSCIFHSSQPVSTSLFVGYFFTLKPARKEMLRAPLRLGMAVAPLLAYLRAAIVYTRGQFSP